HVPRRRALGRLLAVVGGLGTLGLVGTRPAAAQPSPQTLLTVSGGGVNVKQMPSPDGLASVPLRESFSFDAHYAQCIVEDNGADFVMDTATMGKVTIAAHQFFMGMYADHMSLVSIKQRADGALVARLTGSLGCATYAGTAATSFGSRTALEPAFFDIEAVDGSEGGGTAGDSF